MISIIIPVLNEAAVISETLAKLQGMRQSGHEVILVDAGSEDNTVNTAQAYVDSVVNSKRGRAVQMNAGAAQAKGDILWFLHADTRVFDDADKIIQQALSPAKRQWGRFDVQLSGGHVLFRLIERMMNLRSCLTGIATGDQGIFVTSVLFRQVGGFPQQPLMEDIELSRRLKSFARPACIRQKLITSSRRWEQHGILSTVCLMWSLRLAYALGVPAEKLAKKYH